MQANASSQLTAAVILSRSGGFSNVENIQFNENLSYTSSSSKQHFDATRQALVRFAWSRPTLAIFVCILC